MINLLKPELASLLSSSRVQNYLTHIVRLHFDCLVPINEPSEEVMQRSCGSRGKKPPFVAPDETAPTAAVRASAALQRGTSVQGTTAQCRTRADPLTSRHQDSKPTDGCAAHAAPLHTLGKDDHKSGSHGDAAVGSRCFISTSANAASALELSQPSEWRRGEACRLVASAPFASQGALSHSPARQGLISATLAAPTVCPVCGRITLHRGSSP